VPVSLAISVWAVDTTELQDFVEALYEFSISVLQRKCEPCVALGDTALAVEQAGSPGDLFLTGRQLSSV
jgi:hypothetical protein